MSALYLIPNGPRPTTAKQVAVATGTNIKTMLQVKAGTTKPLIIVAWGVSFDGSAAATPPSVEFIETDVAATVTAHVTSGIIKYNAEALIGGDPVTNLILVGTAATGFTATVEGTIADSRPLDPELIAPTNQYIHRFPLGQEPIIQISKFARIRVHAGATVNCLCWMLVGT